MHIYLEQPWTSHAIGEMRPRIVAGAHPPLTLVLRRCFPTSCASVHLASIERLMSAL